MARTVASKLVGTRRRYLMIYVESQLRALDPGVQIPPPFVRDHGWIASQRETCAVSVSQITSSQDEQTGCWARWGFEKIFNRRTSSAAADLGKEVHAQREAWLKDGTPFDLTTKAGEIALSGSELLPDPGTALVEHKFEYWLRERVFEFDPASGKVSTIDGGLLLVGLMDLVYHGDAEALGAPSAVLCIDDHKTHGRFPPKTEQALRSDVQWNGYVAIGFAEVPTVDYIRTRWLYLCTTKPYKSTPVEVWAERSDPRIHAMWTKIVERSNAIETLRRARQGEPVERLLVVLPEEINQFPKRFGSCGAFGGCGQGPTKGGPCEQSTDDEMIDALFAR